MRYGIFSDIHGNRQAWSAVQSDMQALTVQVPVCLGDVVGYGPCPQEVVDAVRSCTANVVLGNHDAAAAGMIDTSLFNPRAREVIDWTRAQLDAESLEFLAELPLKIEADEILFVHAEVVMPARFGYIDDTEVAKENFAALEHFVTFVGHTHDPAVFELQEDGSVLRLPDLDCELATDRRYIVNVGSVGEPRQAEDLRARYVIYDSDRRMLFFRQIAFDVDDFRADWIESGLESMPFLLQVVDDRRAEFEETLRAMRDEHGAGWEVMEATVSGLVLPIGIDAEASSESMPVPESTRARQPHHPRVALVLVPLIALLLAVTAFLAIRTQARRPAEVSPFIIHADRSPSDRYSPGEADQSVVLPSEATEVGASRPPAPETAPEVVRRSDSSPVENPVMTPAAVVDLPAVQVVPVNMPEPDSGRALPPVDLSGFAEGLLLYAPFDEAEGAMSASDLSPGGRNFEAATLSLGHPGRVATALRLDHPAADCASVSQVLPAMTELTISLWLKVPRETEESGRIVSIGALGEVRLEKGEIVADLEPGGERAAVPLSVDGEWHHVLVEHGPGITMVWIDNATVSLPVSESLAQVPVEAVPVIIGAAGLDLFLDELAIWKQRFNPEERENLYRRGLAGGPLLSPTRVVAHWSFDDEDGSKRFADAVGDHDLGAYKAWMPMEGVAPDPVPLTVKPNHFAAQILQVGERPNRAGTFAMRPEEAFTYEGWVKFNGGTGGTLGGTISEGAEAGAQGWRVAVRRHRGANAFVSFLYDTGSRKIQALARDVPIFDGYGHHFAAVWKPTPSRGEGVMQLFIDNEMVASASLPLAQLHSESVQPFRIEAERIPFTIDEVRFSSGALHPGLFLTAGIATHPWDDPYYEPESLLERRDRELRERRLVEREARARAEAERQEKEKQEELAEEERKKLEEERRKGGRRLE